MRAVALVPFFLVAMLVHACNAFPAKAFKKIMEFFVVSLPGCSSCYVLLWLLSVGFLSSGRIAKWVRCASLSVVKALLPFLDAAMHLLWYASAVSFWRRGNQWISLQLETLSSMLTKIPLSTFWTSVLAIHNPRYYWESQSGALCRWSDGAKCHLPKLPLDILASLWHFCGDNSWFIAAIDERLGKFCRRCRSDGCSALFGRAVASTLIVGFVQIAAFSSPIAAAQHPQTWTCLCFLRTRTLVWVAPGMLRAWPVRSKQKAPSAMQAFHADWIGWASAMYLISLMLLSECPSAALILGSSTCESKSAGAWAHSLWGWSFLGVVPFLCLRWLFPSAVVVRWINPNFLLAWLLIVIWL